MVPISFDSLLIVAGISVLVPVVLGLLPRLPVPGAVLMVIGGIVVGPSVLGWARIDAPVEVLSDLGLGMLLFLAGLEIDVERPAAPAGRARCWSCGECPRCSTCARSAALVAAGLLSAALFPAAAGRLLARAGTAGRTTGK